MGHVTPQVPSPGAVSSGYYGRDCGSALAEARPDIVTMPHFAVARHTKIWNYDQTDWNGAITEWVQANSFSSAAD